MQVVLLAGFVRFEVLRTFVSLPADLTFVLVNVLFLIVVVSESY